MKKLIYLLLIIPAFLFSCKKDHSSKATPTGKKYALKFNVTNFTAQKDVFSAAKRTNKLKVNDVINASDYLDVLYYYTFDSNGNIVSKQAQDSTMSNFGTITDSLPAGQYTLVIVAGKKGLVTQGTDFASTDMTYGNFDWKDTFVDQEPLTVSDANLSKDITLARSVGKLEVHLQDTIPPNAYSIRVGVFDEFKVYSFSAFGPPNGNVETDTTFTTAIIPASAKGKPDFIIDRIMDNVYFSCSATIVCRDASNKIIAQAQTEDMLQFQANNKTILYGKLFNKTNNNTQFTVKVDTAWNSPGTIDF